MKGLQQYEIYFFKKIVESQLCDILVGPSPIPLPSALWEP